MNWFYSIFIGYKNYYKNYINKFVDIVLARKNATYQNWIRSCFMMVLDTKKIFINFTDGFHAVNYIK